MAVLKKFFLILTTSALLFVLILSIKRSHLPQILFFEGIIIMLIVNVIILIALKSFYYAKFKKEFVHYFYQSIIASLLILTFHTTVITIVDRSISVHILSYIQSNPNTSFDKVSKNINIIFSDDGLKKRISEQISIGNIEKKDNYYILTNKGKIFYYTFGVINNLFNTDKHIMCIEK
jgi:predicted transcriptional regulator